MKINPKSLLFFIFLFYPLSFAQAQENDTLKDAIVVIDSTAEKEHQVTFTLDLVNRYIWRGQSWGGNYFVVQPTIEYAPTDKLTFGIWATSNFKKDYYYDDGETAAKGYQEVDLYISYHFTKYISLELWDYYWPSVSKEEGIDNSFFNYGTNSVKTLVTELNFDFTESTFPAHGLISTFIAGNDYKYDEDVENPKQNYTTYLELGYVFSTFKGIELDASIGAVLNNKAAYYSAGDYDKVSFVSMGMEVSRTFKLGHSFEMKPFVNYIHNGATKNTEVFGKNFLLFGISFDRI